MAANLHGLQLENAQRALKIGLAKNQTLHALNDDERNQMVQRANFQLYEHNETISEQGTTANNFCFLVNGRVSSTQIIPGSDVHSERVINPGQFFCEEKPGTPRMGTAVAVETETLVAMFEYDVWAMLSARPDIMAQVEHQLHRRVAHESGFREALFWMLRSNPNLAGMTDEELAPFALERARLNMEELGTRVLYEGDRPDVDEDGFFVLIAGQLKVSRAGLGTEAAEQVINHIYPGQLFGELALLKKDTRNANVDTVADSIIARFTQSDWETLLGYDNVKENFQKAAETDYRPPKHNTFPGQGPDEYAPLKTRRSGWAYIASLTLPLVFMLLGLIIVILLETLNAGRGFEYFILSIFGIIAGVWAIYNFLEWRNDYFIVSSERVIHIEDHILAGVFRDEAPLDQVLDVVAFTPNFIARLLGYWFVNISTAGVGVIEFHGIDHGDKIRAMIFDLRKRNKERQQAHDLASIRNSLQTYVGVGELPLVEQLSIDKLKQKDEAPPAWHQTVWQKSKENAGNFVKYFLPIVREDKDGNISWRRHLLLLVAKVWLPLLGFFVSLGLFIAALVGVFPIMAGLFLIPTVGFYIWYLFRYDDWHKDVYTVTNDRIIHREAAAFRLTGELVRTTTFDNVQSINYISPNFLARVINLGNVVITTASVGDETNLTFDAIAYPKDVQQEVFKRWVNHKHKKRLEDRKNEELRFTTWLREYHKMYGQPIVPTLGTNGNGHLNKAEKE